MNRLTITDLPLVGLKLIERQRVGDSRGFLSRLFCADELATAGWQKSIAQVSHSYTANSGTVRGMHYQRPPNAEMKLVACIQGEVWDVAVDLRVDSPTFLQWHGEILSGGNNRALLIPEGFAHGLQALTDDVAMLYCHSDFYSPGVEVGLNPQDTRLAIQWPLPVTELSTRDARHPMITNKYEGVRL